MEEIKRPMHRSTKEKRFQCLCERRYGSITSLRNHINIKHSHEKEKHDARVTELEAEIKVDKKRLSANNEISLTLKDIDAYQKDLLKFAIVDRAHLRIASVFKGEGLLNTAEEDEMDCFEEDIDGEMNARDFNLIGEVHELIVFYKLDDLFEKDHEFPELALQPKSGPNGKNISMKKELTQIYCREWAAKMDLQLELFALQVWQHLSGDEVIRVESCSKEMWGEDCQMIQILKQYYEDLLDNYLRG